MDCLIRDCVIRSKMARRNIKHCVDRHSGEIFFDNKHCAGVEKGFFQNDRFPGMAGFRKLTMATMILLAACQHNSPPTETLPFYTTADFTPHWLDANAAAMDSLHRIAPFALVNQNSDTITERTFAGKIYVADFIFTSCGGICPTMTCNMGKVLHTENFFLVDRKGHLRGLYNGVMPTEIDRLIEDIMVLQKESTIRFGPVCSESTSLKGLKSDTDRKPNMTKQ